MPAHVGRLSTNFFSYSHPLRILHKSYTHPHAFLYILSLSHTHTHIRLSPWKEKKTLTHSQLEGHERNKRRDNLSRFFGKKKLFLLKPRKTLNPAQQKLPVFSSFSSYTTIFGSGFGSDITYNSSKQQHNKSILLVGFLILFFDFSFQFRSICWLVAFVCLCWKYVALFCKWIQCLIIYTNGRLFPSTRISYTNDNFMFQYLILTTNFGVGQNFGTITTTNYTI